MFGATFDLASCKWRGKVKFVNIKKSIVAASLVGLLASPVVASATDVAFGDTSIKVSYADLNINSKQGVSALYKRLQSASEEVCGPLTYSEAGNLNLLSLNKACYRATLSSAVAKVGSEALSELHKS